MPSGIVPEREQDVIEPTASQNTSLLTVERGPSFPLRMVHRAEIVTGQSPVMEHCANSVRFPITA